MKVIQNTPEMLVIEDRPVVLALMLSAFALALTAVCLVTFDQGMPLASIVSGAFAALLFAILGRTIKRIRLFLDARHDLFSVRTQGVRGTTTISYPLAALQRAIVQESRASDSTTYRLAYVIDRGDKRGTHPLTDHFTGGRGPAQGADVINDWLSAYRS